jgi:hypothetical protein
MKPVLALCLAVGSAWIASASPGLAQHDPYRWCAEMGGGDDGGMLNCYFMTREQCEATVAGVGGFCRLNQFYTGPANAGPSHRRTEKKRTPPR